MATPDSSFVQLLNRLPLAQSSDTVTIVGALARSPQEGKFAIVVPDGRTFTLDVAAVKQHKVVAESVGQVLVELELDAKKLPADVREAPQGPTGKGGVSEFTGMADVVTPTFAAADQGTHIADLAPTTIFYLDNPHGSGAAWWDVGPGPGFGAPGVPFVLAAPHQAPAGTIAALQSMSWFTPPWGFDHPIPKPKADPKPVFDHTWIQYDA